MKYKVGIASGAFDIIHIGHIMFLEECKKMCDKLIVVISSDKLISQIKEKFPRFNENQRKKVISSIKYVDETIIRYNQFDMIDICQNNNCNVIFKGNDYKNKEWESNLQTTLKQYGINIKLIDHKYTDIHSSSFDYKDDVKQKSLQYNQNYNYDKLSIDPVEEFYEQLNSKK